MDKLQKKSAIVLAVAGILILGFGFWLIGSRITGPFKLQPLDASLFKTQNILDLQTKDTDKDGITDYEEINLYNTSPYLEDTDSDGAPDGEEIQNNTDPNCPSGKVCGATSATVDTTVPSADSSVPATIDINNLTPAEVRQLLKDGGMSDADLKKLDDQTLMQIYQEALKGSQ